MATPSAAADWKVAARLLVNMQKEAFDAAAKKIELLIGFSAVTIAEILGFLLLVATETTPRHGLVGFRAFRQNAVHLSPTPPGMFLPVSVTLGLTTMFGGVLMGVLALGKKLAITPLDLDFLLSNPGLDEEKLSDALTEKLQTNNQVIARIDRSAIRTTVWVLGAFALWTVAAADIALRFL